MSFDMGPRNIQFANHMIDLEADQQGHSHLQPDPCIFYGSVPNFPQPNIHSVIPAPGNQCNFTFHPMPDRQDGTLFYGMPPYNGVQPQPPNLDLAVAAPSSHYTPYLAPQSDNYSRNIPYVDGVRGLFKRKNAEWVPSNYHYHNVSAGTSSSVAPVISRPAESDITQTDAAASLLPAESASTHSATHLIQGNYVAQPVQYPGNPWLDMHFGANNGDIGTFAWTQLPYVQGVQGYQVAAASRSSAGFPHPPIAQGHSNPHHPTTHLQAVRGYNVNYPQAASSSRRIPTVSSSNTSINPFQDVVDVGPAFLAPVPPTGFRLYRPHRRDLVIDQNARNHNIPHLRVLPEDEVAILEIPGYQEAGDRDSIDQHSDMRLDIDHMSYEELLALGEQIGSVTTGLPEEFIQNNLKTRTFTSSSACLNLQDTTSPDRQKINFCVVCQTDYEHEDNIGTLDCGHEYHRGCIKKWLVVKNTCPVCKSTALKGKGKDL
ncbi:hypothetical protein CDL12_06444 [Handroanthus impetiginosus]|uniref:RING-type E3 ubiquitin transferase n=1 Tax=Handroanthus impetiginosus TaxID=429701 RepID=A0A2G9HTP0_9LAMI|nr:hypothetical protein CDL12_06444 [Handroanthus impetiginosus]